jgi:hypothetical protein
VVIFRSVVNVYDSEITETIMSENRDFPCPRRFIKCPSILCYKFHSELERVKGNDL